MGTTMHEICGFKTASGEILADEGVRVVHGYLENGCACSLKGHVTDVHKPLMSASRMAVKDDLISVVHSLGGHLIPKTSTLAQKIRELVNQELRRDPSQEFSRLYLEDGVYNFS